MQASHHVQHVRPLRQNQETITVLANPNLLLFWYPQHLNILTSQPTARLTVYQ